jgi:hypothetical protein
MTARRLPRGGRELVTLNPRRIKARGSRPAVEDDGATRGATHLTVSDRNTERTMEWCPAATVK